MVLSRHTQATAHTILLVARGTIPAAFNILQAVRKTVLPVLAVRACAQSSIGCRGAQQTVLPRVRRVAQVMPSRARLVRGREHVRASTEVERDSAV
jgi:hypothetical protein